MKKSVKVMKQEVIWVYNLWKPRRVQKRVQIPFW